MILLSRRLQKNFSGLKENPLHHISNTLLWKIRFALCCLQSLLLTASLWFLFHRLLRCFTPPSFPSFRICCDVAFGNLQVNTCMRLTGAYRSLPRPSSSIKPSHPPNSVSSNYAWFHEYESGNSHISNLLHSDFVIQMRINIVLSVIFYFLKRFFFFSIFYLWIIFLKLFSFQNFVCDFLLWKIYFIFQNIFAMKKYFLYFFCDHGGPAGIWTRDPRLARPVFYRAELQARVWI